MSPRLLQLQDPIVRIVIEVQPPVLCIAIQGELDLSCSNLLEAVTAVDLADVTDVSIILTDLDFCDVAGLRLIAQLHDQHRREGRRVHFVDPPRCVRRIAELAGRSDLLTAS